VTLDAGRKEKVGIVTAGSKKWMTSIEHGRNEGIPELINTRRDTIRENWERQEDRGTQNRILTRVVGGLGKRLVVVGGEDGVDRSRKTK